MPAIISVDTFDRAAARQARTLFEQGQRSRALSMLREHVDDLLDTDYVDVARMVAMEFVYMMGALDRLADAAHVLPYLDTMGDFGVLIRNTLLADAVNKIAVHPELVPAH